MMTAFMSALRGRLRSGAFDIYLAACNALLAMPGHAFRRLVMRRLVRATLGEGTAIERRVRVQTKGGLTIGKGCNVNSGTVLDGRGGLVIGSLVNISPDATILTAQHDVASPAFDGQTAPTRVADRAWVSTRAIVLPGTTVGEGAVVAAGAVVSKDVAPWTIVAGNPAREIGRRPQDAQQTLPRYARWLH
jgi:acetyltransferase-like isoleucine patch superfamily enzyme